MKNLDVQKLGLQELNTAELQQTNGGWAHLLFALGITSAKVATGIVGGACGLAVAASAYFRYR